MAGKQLFEIDEVPDYLLSNLESRDVALWVRSLPKDPPSQNSLVAFLGLPWRLILFDTNDTNVLETLEAAASFSDPMTRKRGYVQIIDGDPSHIELPQRCLPIYLLQGRHTDPAASDFQRRLRRMTTLEELRRSGPRQILVISDHDDPVPPDLDELWLSGFRSHLLFVSGKADAREPLERWVQERESGQAANLLHLPAGRLVEHVLQRYQETYPEDRQVIRIRDRQGASRRVDVTGADAPERPILERYSLIQERDLTPLVPEELSEKDFIGFFRNPEDSWRPYAAGLPWLRDARWLGDLQSHLSRLDAVGPEENFVAYISSEPGAGGTTLARSLAWRLAQNGYPVLVAKPLPFVPDALPIVNFMNRVLSEMQTQPADLHGQEEELDRARLENRESESGSARYEAPWVIVFDSLHWEDRDSELVRFRDELEKSGRPVCLLVVTGTVLGLSFFNTRVFRKVAELNQSIPREGALELGRHLTLFLRVYGKERQDRQWSQFHEEHTVRYLEGQAAFWVTLSFWIQGQYNLFESIQEWMYRSFKEYASERSMQDAILEIAALSSERFPMPEALLPETTGKWPVAQLLEDSLSFLAPLGLVRISEDGEKYWALIHDILGRFLINALFYDFPMRDGLGFAEATDAEHLRFLLLRRISQKGLLGERGYRSIGEDFATSIFKIDPDHGHGSFTAMWREILGALDAMPQSLRNTSRVFRHHAAVSRRRVAKLDSAFYSVTIEDKFELLTKAIEDITYALTFIEYVPGSESDLNLYNSLAIAYLDLVEVETLRDAPIERIAELRRLANDATRKAYDENPTNSFVVETYVKNLLQSARHSPEQAVSYCIDALGILFSARTANEATYRQSQLGELADQALNILFSHSSATSSTLEPQSPLDVLLNAWKALTEGREQWQRIDLSDAPRENQVRALDLLADPAGRGNMQVIRMRYDLTSIVHPYALKQQLEFAEPLQATNYRVTAQLRLEYAILLYQNSRFTEGDKVFFVLRRQWRETEHFVQVPERLRWLLAADDPAFASTR